MRRVWVLHYLVDEGKVHAQAIGNDGGALCASGVGGDDDGLFVVGNILLDVVLEERFAVEIIYRDVKEPLILGVVEVHGDDMIGASAGEQVGNKGAGLCNPLLVAGLWLEVGDGCRVFVVVSSEAPFYGA